MSKKIQCWLIIKLPNALPGETILCPECKKPLCFAEPPSEDIYKFVCMEDGCKNKPYFGPLPKPVAFADSVKCTECGTELEKTETGMWRGTMRCPNDKCPKFGKYAGDWHG